jgi:hypothetical protein
MNRSTKEGPDGCPKNAKIDRRKQIRIMKSALEWVQSEARCIESRLVASKALRVIEETR